MRPIIMYVVTGLTISLLWFTPNNIYAQEDKNEIKAYELIAQAADNSSASERRDLYEKALKLFEKAGHDKTANAIIADAMVEAKDYNNAARYYGYAGADAKKEGMMKIGDAYIQDAKEDPAKAYRHFAKTISYYSKAKEKRLGYARVGDAYFEQGIKSYEKALKNYVQGKAGEQISKLGDAYYAAGEQYYADAARAYSLVGTEESFIKSGNLYFDIEEYEWAYAQYDTAKYMDGIIRYADKMFSLGDMVSVNMQYRILADHYGKEGNMEMLNSLAAKLYKLGLYELSAILYGKAGDEDKASKSELYQAIKSFDLEQAKALCEQIPDAEMAAALKRNNSYLTELIPVLEQFDIIKQDEPHVQMIVDEKTHKHVVDPADLKVLEENYEMFRSDILSGLNKVSSNYNKLNNETLKKIVRQRFLEYGATRNILDNATFKRKLSDSQVKTKDTFMQSH